MTLNKYLKRDMEENRIFSIARIPRLLSAVSSKTSECQALLHAQISHAGNIISVTAYRGPSGQAGPLETS